MKVTEFVSEVTRLEGGAVNLPVAQVAEVVKLINDNLFGIPYMLIRMKRMKKVK